MHFLCDCNTTQFFKIQHIFDKNTFVYKLKRKSKKGKKERQYVSYLCIYFVNEPSLHLCT